METDKTPQEQCFTSTDNEAHSPEMDNKSFLDRTTTTEGNSNTPVSSEDDFDEQNREDKTVQLSVETIVESKIEAPGSNNVEQESYNASAAYANKDVETATHADDLIDPKTDPNVSKNTLTKTEHFKDNYKNNQAFPSDTPSNLIVNPNDSGQEQGNGIQPNKDECREFGSTVYVAKNEIRPDNERVEDDENNVNKDTKDGATDEIDKTQILCTQSLEDCSGDEKKEHESSNNQQTYLSEIKQNKFCESQTQTKIIEETTDEDRQESEVNTEPDKTTDNENHQDDFNYSESAKREHSEQNIVPEYNQNGKQETLCQLNAKSTEKAEVPHDDSLTPRLAGEDAQLLSKQENSGLADSEDEAAPFNNEFESLGEDMKITQKDELEKERKSSSNLEEERQINLKDELEKEKQLSSKQREAYQREIEDMKAALQQQEEQNEAYQRENENMKAALQQQEELQEENNTNIAKIKSLIDKDRKNELLINSLRGEVTQLQIDKQRSLSKERETLKQVKDQHSKLLKSERDRASAIQRNYEKDKQKWRDAYDRKRKEHEAELEGIKHHYAHIEKEQTQYWEAVVASLNEQICIQTKSHEDLLYRFEHLVLSFA